ncbi:MAG: fructosamine kinase family protein [Cyclobacteriaceae bacterium]|nr:fructosamine kinase family protein [Cyclobacteriaceae bacterium]MCH8517440.1 fructosamine kinase family protein [Cyclobacteriaceae bacterium]
MINPNFESFFGNILHELTGEALPITNLQIIGGGCINNSVRVDRKDRAYFVKWNESNKNDLYEKEAKGLQLLYDKKCIRVPKVYGYGYRESKNFLICEYIDSGIANQDYWMKLGESIADLHYHQSELFGLEFDNYIGLLPQVNDQKKEWPDFYIEKRIHIQLSLALYNQRITKAYYEEVKALYPKMKEILPKSPVSLLHGDLWSGNVMPDTEGNPVIFDPAPYYGSREVEIAFTELFGGFDDIFYAQYTRRYPLAEGYENRKALYQLYPLLVHLNLFGESYKSGIDRIIKDISNF